MLRARLDKDEDVFPQVGDACKVALEPKGDAKPTWCNAEKSDGSAAPLAATWRDTMEFLVTIKSSSSFDPAEDEDLPKQLPDGPTSWP